MGLMGRGAILTFQRARVVTAGSRVRLAAPFSGEAGMVDWDGRAGVVESAVVLAFLAVASWVVVIEAVRLMMLLVWRWGLR